MIPGSFKYGGHRNSYAELNEIYFWTITVRNYHHLLHSMENKLVVINSLQWLVQNNLVEIYGYVIMPNHIHLVWQQLKMNGKEFPKNSFIKFTSKSLLSKLEKENSKDLKKYEIIAADRKYNIWQRDPLAIWIFSKEMAIQKLDYTHFNLANHIGIYVTVLRIIISHLRDFMKMVLMIIISLKILWRYFDK